MKVFPVGNQTYRFVLHHIWNQNKQNIMIDLKSQWKLSKKYQVWSSILRSYFMKEIGPSII